MKLEKHGEDFEFFLLRREKEVLVYILKLYPRTPPAHHRLTQTATTPELEGTRRLLDESIEVGRKETGEKLEQWLATHERFIPVEKGFRLKILAGEIEWLLQVLNEIRIGSWIRLGAPEVEIDMSKINHDNAADFGVMNMSGLFVMYLLDALGGEA